MVRLEPAMASKELTIPVTEFKANCLKLFKRLEHGELSRVTVTRRGKPIAMVEPNQITRRQFSDIYGIMRGKIHLSPDYDPFEQVIDEPNDPFIGIEKPGDAA
jgi:antitoxin (DNA-binding transcriptional repressor) of toxin-antitoxin stability system